VWNSLPATVIAKFHYTDTDTVPTRTKSAHVVGYELNSTTRTRTGTRTFCGETDPHGPNGVSPQKSPCPCRARVRVRVVEFSYKTDQFRQHLKTCLFGAQKSQRIVTFDYCALYECSYLLTYLLTYLIGVQNWPVVIVSD